MNKRSHLAANRITRLRPEYLIVASFASAIALGTVLLMLPCAQVRDVGFSEALFTATSAMCVTGLTVVDTGSSFTIFGQWIILLLIQIGGLGIMTFAAIAFDMLGRRLSLNTQEALTSSLVHESIARGFRAHLKRMVGLLFAMETAGAVVIFIGLAPSRGFSHACYSAVFHSVSAFCNAGFSIYSDSLAGLKDNMVVMATISFLIVLGGIGHPVLFNLWQVIRTKHAGPHGWWACLNVHTRVTVLTTVLLLLAGCIFLSAIGITPGTPSAMQRLADAAFQSVSARTAGFSTVAIDQLPLRTLLVLALLMFIGGSPGSCAGGIKTTTLAIWAKQLWSRMRNTKGVILCGRYIPQMIVRRASMLVAASVLWNLIGILFLSITEANASLHEILFEQISAFGTVGLSAGLTPRLTEAGRAWIEATMFFGRTGPLTIMLLFLTSRPCDIRYPEAKVMIG